MVYISLQPLKIVFAIIQETQGQEQETQGQEKNGEL